MLRNLLIVIGHNACDRLEMLSVRCLWLGTRLTRRVQILTQIKE